MFDEDELEVLERELDRATGEMAAALQRLARTDEGDLATRLREHI